MRREKPPSRAGKRKQMFEKRTAAMEQIKDGAWHILGKLYSGAYNYGFDAGADITSDLYTEQEAYLKDRIEKLEWELHNAKQAYYQSQTECRRLSALCSPECKAAFDEVIENSSRLARENERMKQQLADKQQGQSQASLILGRDFYIKEENTDEN